MSADLALSLIEVRSRRRVTQCRGTRNLRPSCVSAVAIMVLPDSEPTRQYYTAYAT